MKRERRYHCNVCNAAYSVTVGTVFHGTKLPLQKWFLGIYEIVMSTEGSVTVRNLASTIHANKDTAGRVLRSIKKTMAKDLIFFGKIADSIRSFEDEGYF
jgi:transposase-like protein